MLVLLFHFQIVPAGAWRERNS